MLEIIQSLPLLQAAGGQGSIWTMIVPFGLIIVIFYFLVLRPQNKRQKEAKAMLESLRKGDRVATIGGMRGLVVSVKDQVVVLKVDENTKIEFNKSAIASILERKEAVEESAE